MRFVQMEWRFRRSQLVREKTDSIGGPEGTSDHKHGDPRRTEGTGSRIRE